MSRSLLIIFVVIVLGLLPGLFSWAAAPDEAYQELAADPIDTTFTYQGHLNDEGVPATGVYDLRFRLYDSASGRTQIGPTLTLDDVEIIDGAFTAALDFGEVFDGSARWLEMSVRAGSSSDAYTILSPRQALTAAPYALSLRAGAVISGAIGNNEAALALHNSATLGHALLASSDESSALRVTEAGVNGLSVFNAGRHGAYIFSAAKDGFAANFAGENGFSVVSAGQNGLLIEEAGDPVLTTASPGPDGVEVGGTSGNGVYLGAIGNDGVVVENAVGDGLQVNFAAGRGVYLPDTDSDGIYVGSAGSPPASLSSSSTNGVEVAGAEGNGLYVGTTGSAGVFVQSAGGNGISVGNVSRDGLQITNALSDGIHIDHGGEDGIFICSTGANNTCTFTRDDLQNGIEIGNPEHVGLYIVGSGNLDAYFGENGIYVSGGCAGCNIVYYGINTSNTELTPGIVVALTGTRTSLPGFDEPLLEVVPAASGDTVVGIVHGSADLVVRDSEESNAQDALLAPRQDAAQPGDFVAITVAGMAQVRVSKKVTTGQKLTADIAGTARPLHTVVVEGIELAENASILGTVLTEPDAEELVWVLVNPQ